MNAAASGNPLKDFEQELRTNRKTQGTAGVFVAVLAWMVWMFWPEQRKAHPRAAAGPAAVLDTVLDASDPQIAALRKLPDLAKLDRAGALPGDANMSRDLFLFDSPQPMRKVVQIAVPPLPPPTPEELEAQRLKAERDAQDRTRPGGLRYLGFFSLKQRGILAAFMKGEEPVDLPLGDLSFPGWKLVKIDDTGAEFQNLKFPDMRHKLQPSDGGGPKPETVRNEF